jgi:nucleotide-binding universal stress UspA family protein
MAKPAAGRILVLLDGSTWSHKSALQAVHVAKKSGAEVVFFTVLDRSEARALAFNFCAQSDMCNLIPGYELRIWRDMRRSINAELSELLTHYARQKVECSSKIIEGTVRDVVISEANSGNYQLIVMGAYGKSGKSHAGTLFEQIAGLVNPPILVVR